MDNHLPIHSIQGSFISCLKNNNKIILRAPTGSGKSTQIPQYLLDEVIDKDKTVIVLQPRRIAARILASYLARMRKSKLGGEVGYQVRLEGVHSAETRLMFVTEGILLNRLLRNDLLHEVGAIVFDEFHERHIETDVSLALALQLQKKSRPGLKIVVMSATLDSDVVQNYMEGCTVLETHGKAYPVDIRYKQPKPAEHVWDFAAMQLEASLSEFTSGSALVFMPGAYEIRKTVAALLSRPSLQSFRVFPLYGSLPKDEQDLAVGWEGRKIIVTTNIAETSLTIPDIKLVIDSGLARVARFDPRRGINTLFVEPISVSSANQRAGRAGRTAPGVCLRLWSEFEHQNRNLQDQPEIHRIDLSELMLGLAANGAFSVETFPWLESPTPLAIQKAKDLLITLGAIYYNFTVTPLGREMANINAHPRFARMLLKASELGCLPSACVVAAIAQTQAILFSTTDVAMQHNREHTFGNPGSDLLFELNAWLWAGERHFKHNECSLLGINVTAVRQAAQVALQLLHQVKAGPHNVKKLPHGNISFDESEKLRECIFAGFPDFIAIRHQLNSPVCQMVDRSGKLHRDSIVKDAKFLVVTELEEIKSPTGVQIMLRKVTSIDELWLTRLCSPAIDIIESEQFDNAQKKVVKICERRFKGLVLSREYGPVDDDERASQLIVKAINDGLVEFPQWDEEVEQYVCRVNFTAKNAPHYQIPQIDAEARDYIIQQAVYKCRNAKDVLRCKLWPSLKAWLSREQNEVVDFVAPVTIELPRRKRPSPLRYAENGDVILSETVQALYDCPLPVTVAEGKVSVIFEILAPSRRPVQITRDLDYFWKNSYNDVKKELKGRYPKHEWR